MPPKLSSSVKTAIRRQRENHQFSLALDALITYNPADKSALYNKLGYASDFVRVDALTAASDSSTTKPQQNDDSDDDEDQNNTTDINNVLTAEISDDNGQKKPENSADASRRTTKTKKESNFLFNDKNSEKVKFSEVASLLWNASDRQCLPKPPQNVAAAVSSSKSSVADQNRQTSTHNKNDNGDILGGTTAGDSSNLLLSASSKERMIQLNGTDEFQWFRNRSQQLERMQSESWKRYNKDVIKTEQDLAKKVMLTK